MALPTISKKDKKELKTRLAVDYPRQNEVVTSPQYTLRISVPEGMRKVEVAVDQGEWQPARESSGHWWFDWSRYETGEHQVVVAIETPTGKRISSEPHEFFVDLNKK